jgi:hypothetical protein
MHIFKGYLLFSLTIHIFLVNLKSLDIVAIKLENKGTRICAACPALTVMVTVRLNFAGTARFYASSSVIMFCKYRQARLTVKKIIAAGR